MDPKEEVARVYRRAGRLARLIGIVLSLAFGLLAYAATAQIGHGFALFIGLAVFGIAMVLVFSGFELDGP